MQHTTGLATVVASALALAPCAVAQDIHATDQLGTRERHLLDRWSEHVTIDPEGEWWWTKIEDRVESDHRFADHPAFDTIEPEHPRRMTEAGRTALRTYGNYNRPAPYWLNLDTGAFRSGQHAVLERINDRRAAIRKQARESLLESPDVVRGVVDQVVDEGLVVTLEGLKDGRGFSVQILLSDHPNQGAFVDGDRLPPSKTTVVGRFKGTTVLRARRTLEWRKYEPGLQSDLAAIDDATPNITFRDFRDATPDDVYDAIQSGKLTAIPKLRPIEYVAEKDTRTRVHTRHFRKGNLPYRDRVVHEGDPSLRAWKWEVDWVSVPASFTQTK